MLLHNLERPILFAFLLLLLLNGKVLASSEAKKDLILATTTSTQDSGLLDVLVPLFEKKTDHLVKTIAVGSGQAIALGKRGEADVLLVHSPEQEREFMDKGFGIKRRLVMYNDFVIAGPKNDPARIRGSKSAKDAFKRIAETASLFVSRADNSGTHLKEMSIWKNTGINPEGKRWYQEVGLGMGQILGVASEKRAYTLCDRATFVSLKRNLDLEILLEGDPTLLNIYHVIEVNPEKWRKVNIKAARAFADFLVSKEVQEIIGRFGLDRFGSPLFFPRAGKDKEFD